jgi:hypothetical protein
MTQQIHALHRTHPQPTEHVKRDHRVGLLAGDRRPARCFAVALRASYRRPRPTPSRSLRRDAAPPPQGSRCSRARRPSECDSEGKVRPAPPPRLRPSEASARSTPTRPRRDARPSTPWLHLRLASYRVIPPTDAYRTAAETTAISRAARAPSSRKGAHGAGPRTKPASDVRLGHRSSGLHSRTASESARSEGRPPIPAVVVCLETVRSLGLTLSLPLARPR